MRWRQRGGREGEKERERGREGERKAGEDEDFDTQHT
jgi:hypothetical protein